MILFLLCLVWMVSLTLTKQRVQLEAYNKLNNFDLGITPFIWDFKSINVDVVGSFQHFWQKQDHTQIIHSKVKSNPQLSLNFSGEVINVLQYSELIIHSPQVLKGNLTLQAKINLEDEVFYYLKNIKLSGQSQIIDLNQKWIAVNPDSLIGKDTLTENTLTKISSLVLQFENPDGTIVIDKIVINSDQETISDRYFNVACDGSIAQSGLLDFNNRNIFKLSEQCWLPSNYMWLKHKLINTVAGSVLVLDNTKLWQKTSVHKINKSYTNNLLLNSVLYLTIVLFIFTLYLMTKKFKVSNHTTDEESNGKWLARQVLVKGLRRTIKPYHLSVNYLVVLVPTFFLLLIMFLIKIPDSKIVKLFPMYLLWALFQQFILGYILAQRTFYANTQNRLIASLFAAAVFSIFHMPSVVLMIATFVAGGLWAYSWLVFKRFLPLALSHALLALMFYTVTSDGLLYSAKTFQWFWK